MYCPIRFSEDRVFQFLDYLVNLQRIQLAFTDLWSKYGWNNGRRTQHNATLYKDIQHIDTQDKGLIRDTQYKWHLAYMTLIITMLWHYAECQYAMCRILFIRILIIRVIVIMLNDVMLSVRTTIIARRFIKTLLAVE